MKYSETRYENIYSYNTKRDVKKYRVRFKRTLNGKPTEYSKNGFSSINSAITHRDQIKSEFSENNISIIKSKSITVAAYYEKFSTNRFTSGVWTKDTKKTYDSMFKKHVVPEFGNIPIQKLDRVYYQEFINKKLFVENLAKASVKTLHNCFRALMNDAEYSGVIERNRVTKRIDINKNENERKKFLELDEFHKVLRTAKKVLSPYHFSMFYMPILGLRRGEVMGIRRKNIQLFDTYATLIIDVSRTATENNGKSTKTPSSKRTIKTDLQGAECLKIALNESIEIKKDLGILPHENDFIFVNPDTGIPYNVSELNNIYDVVKEASGIYIYPHMLRHTFVTQIQASGVSQADAAKYVGHSRLDTTNIYTHATKEGELKVVDFIQETFGQ
ncbi:tyrosine-type recombinase/integrase [Carnobacterium divergens]|uniref:tyrosine-type recombinase/integrase n=1 Tax=Carnobacterium divergens TaxID=2748 RepID=UPI0039C9908E